MSLVKFSTLTLHNFVENFEALLNSLQWSWIRQVNIRFVRRELLGQGQLLQTNCTPNVLEI